MWTCWKQSRLETAPANTDGRLEFRLRAGLCPQICERSTFVGLRQLLEHLVAETRGQTQSATGKRGSKSALQTSLRVPLWAAAQVLANYLHFACLLHVCRCHSEHGNDCPELSIYHQVLGGGLTAVGRRQQAAAVLLHQQQAAAFLCKSSLMKSCCFFVFHAMWHSHPGICCGQQPGCPGCRARTAGSTAGGRGLRPAPSCRRPASRRSG